ncbi:helix-turn-helix domain-containing protein [Rhodovibrionaceae bacterium A322]
MSDFERFAIDLADADTLESFYKEQTNTQTSFVQLSRGAAVLSARSLDFGDLRLLQVSGNGQHLWIDNMLSREWRFATLVEAEGTPKIGGQDITLHTAHLLRPGQSADLSTGGHYKTLELTFDAALPDRLGWSCAPGQVAIISQQVSRALTDAAQQAFQDAEWAQKAQGRSFPRLIWRDRFLDLLTQALAPWLMPEAGRGGFPSAAARKSIVARAQALFGDHDFAGQTTADSLAEQIGISKRSLFLAFQQECGVGPRRFREVLRLNALRASLFRASAENASVTVLAQEHGFTELGRMAGNYRRLFGELPKETLKRRVG